MLNEYSLTYRRMGEPFSEAFESPESALSRSSQILHQRWGVPVSVAWKGVEMFDQESLFNDWLQSFEP